VLSPSNAAAAVSAGAATPAWVQHSRDKGLQVERAARMIKGLADEMCEEGVKESSGLSYETDSRG